MNSNMNERFHEILYNNFKRYFPSIKYHDDCITYIRLSNDMNLSLNTTSKSVNVVIYHIQESSNNYTQVLNLCIIDADPYAREFRYDSNDCAILNITPYSLMNIDNKLTKSNSIFSRVRFIGNNFLSIPSSFKCDFPISFEDSLYIQNEFNDMGEIKYWIEKIKCINNLNILNDITTDYDNNGKLLLNKPLYVLSDFDKRFNHELCDMLIGILVCILNDLNNEDSFTNQSLSHIIGNLLCSY